MLARTSISLVFLAVLLGACADPTPSASSTGGAVSAAPTASAGPIWQPQESRKAPERSGGALMRSADGARLYLADEDHKVLRVLPLPFGDEPEDPAARAARRPVPSASASATPAPSGRPRASASASARAAPPAAPPPPDSIPKIPPPPSARQEEISMPGAPAQVLPLDGYVLVTIRDPGLLLVMREEPGNKLREEARIPLAADAWGIGLTPDEKVAVITSAWTHKATGVDWRARKIAWTLDVMREPRAVVIHPNGKTAYVSHLTSGDLTRIDDVAGPAAKASTVAFPAAPARTPLGTTVPGSLGYALVMDETGDRLLAARHALGGLAERAWAGIATVDVLQTRNDRPLLGPRVPGRAIKSSPAFAERLARIERLRAQIDPWQAKDFFFPELDEPYLVQPRAMIVAHRSQTVWVASEGNDYVGEFPLLAAAPIERPLRLVGVGQHRGDPKILDSWYSGIPTACGAPTGLALNQEESLLFVFCRSTYDVATVRIAPREAYPEVTIARLAADTLDESGSRGRRLFYGATDNWSSDHMGCAGCHPEGRDDGHVWHDVPTDERNPFPSLIASQHLAEKTHEGKLGYPVQTPMLAGRVNATGPYGWHAQNPSLLEQLDAGFDRHRWFGRQATPKHWMTGERVNALVPFLRKGLVPPPRPERALTDEEKKGKEIFMSPTAQCSRCHDPASQLTDRIAYSLGKVAPPPGFEVDENTSYKTPSLLFVGGTPPYYHDGRAPTLEALVAKNADRMGKTSHLSAAERAALVAYLETL